ncbi:ribosome small subunit-dependent GTPase A [Planobacterium oryzisoli]|uniref:Small ribosomal subunit biogenesis GTPase RsgA n=1 Tax=Planobacterium oryzisoli TaxID=2771435 RepID=A0A931E7P7_9FLAO|nr:ribosome small subunit-dependent GTPase A [Planobacterium oryzisoli]MBF5027291.1 ribosome small subunit-dependent GTPase A [Planobacterium oryzisoli]
MSNKGLIIKSTGSWYQVQEQESLTVYEARIRGKFKLIKTRLTNPLAVGDRVEFQLEQDDIAWITKIEPRRNYLIRKSVNLSKEAHIIASNIDLACFIFTLKHPETSLGFLDRFLACCEAYGITPVILFSKMDVLSTEEIDIIEEIKAIYAEIGYESLEISSYSGLNLETLKLLIKDKTSVFFGHSGSGKSTLVNALQPSLDLKTAEISQTHLKGKHTTTFAQMHFWEFGGSVIDTPGVREFAMIDVEKEELQHYFPEIFKKGRECKFHNCMHINEPKCAVLGAIDEGEIEESRYVTYLKLMEEAEEENAW